MSQKITIYAQYYALYHAHGVFFFRIKYSPAGPRPAREFYGSYLLPIVFRVNIVYKAVLKIKFFFSALFAVSTDQFVNDQ